MTSQAIETIEDFAAAFEAMHTEQAGREESEDSGVSAGTLESSADESSDDTESAPTGGEEKEAVKADEEMPSKTQFDTLRGRLSESDRARNALARQNEELKQALEAERTAKTAAKNRRPVEIGEDLAEDIKEFESRYPQLAAVVRDESFEGDEARRILAEYGADQAMIYARTVIVEKGAEAKEAKLRADFERKRIADHWGSIYEEVPEVESMTETEAEAFKSDLWGWIQDQPKAEREKLEPVFRGFEGIKPKHVINLYKSYFEATGKSSSQSRISDKAKDAEAIPSRSRGSGFTSRAAKRDLNDPADFEAAFNELAEKDSR